MIDVGERQRATGKTNIVFTRDIAKLTTIYNSHYEDILSLDSTENVRILKYENLVRDTKAEVRKLAAFTGLNLNVSMEMFSPETIKQNDPFTSPPLLQKFISQDSVGRFRSVLSDSEIAEIEFRTRDIMTAFSYPEV